MYTFGNNDPINNADPSGLCPTTSFKSVCLDFFIMSSQAGILRGDGRGFNPYADPSQSRVQIVIDIDDPSQSYFTIAATCVAGGWYCHSPLSGQDVRITGGQGGSFTVDFSLRNSITRIPAIDGQVTLTPNGQGGYASHGSRDAFPSLGIYESQNGQMTTILEQQENAWYDLFPGVGRYAW